MDCGKALAESLDSCIVPSNPYFNIMLRMVATRCMAQALYFSSGVLPQSEYFHYGLAVSIYTHFTSPIRRLVILISFPIGYFTSHKSMITYLIYYSFPSTFSFKREFIFLDEQTTQLSHLFILLIMYINRYKITLTYKNTRTLHAFSTHQQFVLVVFVLTFA